MVTADELPTVFSDVTPVPQDDGPNPVCQIAYKEDFVKAYDYMRAILKLDEKSERALRLTALCLKWNPANYTIWHYRRLCLHQVGLSQERLQQDLDLAAVLGGVNPKNYQIWYHRRALLESIIEDGHEAAQKELRYIASVFEDDAKNYHAWSHRQWILKTVNKEELWKAEIEYVCKLIFEDIRNNSAWNQRWFVAHRGKREALSQEAAQEEANYALEQAQSDPYNESPWRYLIGVVKEQPSLVESCEVKAVEMKDVLAKAGRDAEACASLNSARIDLLEMKGNQDSLQQAIQLADAMASNHDLVRRKYWALRVSELEKKREGSNQ